MAQYDPKAYWLEQEYQKQFSGVGGREFRDALLRGSYQPPQALIDLEAIRKAVAFLPNAAAMARDCLGKYRTLTKFAAECQRLQNASTFVLRFVSASVQIIVRRQADTIQGWIADFRRTKAIREVSWWYVTDCEFKLKELSGLLAPAFVKDGPAQVAALIEPIRAACRSMIAEVDKTASSTRLPRTRFGGAGKLIDLMKRTWKDQKAKVVRDGQTTEVPVRVVGASISEAGWTVDKDGRNRPIRRWVTVNVMYQVPGEKHCRLTWDPSQNYVVQDHQGGGRYGAPGANYSMSSFYFGRCN
jgi:hypothetical protein